MATSSGGIILPAVLPAVLSSPLTGCIISDSSAGSGLVTARCTISNLIVAGVEHTTTLTASVSAGAWSIILPFAALSTPGTEWQLTTPGGATYQGAVPTLSSITFAELLSGYGWYAVTPRSSTSF